MVWPYAAGYSFAIVVGEIAIRCLLRIVDRDAEPNRGAWLGPLVGNVEAAIFTSAILVGKEVLIGAWFVLKVVGTPEIVHAQRLIRQRFLLLTGFVISFSAVGAYGTRWLIDDQWMKAATAAMALVFAVLLLCIHASLIRPESDSADLAGSGSSP